MVPRGFVVGFLPPEEDAPLQEWLAGDGVAGADGHTQLTGYGTRTAKRNVSEGFWTVIFFRPCAFFGVVRRRGYLGLVERA